MLYKLIFTENYNKKASKFLKKHPGLISQYQKTLELLVLNPQHPSLRLHKLKGNLKNLHSASINLSYRISLEFIIEDKKIIPIDVGDHAQVY
jgi:mRNA-degrading endonuclease YafQ of YafQ-DinJ toxin-antitoxin module